MDLALNPNSRLFAFGQIVSTPGALEAFQKAGQTPVDFLKRYARGDWGDCSPDDKKANDNAVMDCERILGVYHLKDGTKIYIITEADRSVTTFLLPEEY